MKVARGMNSFRRGQASPSSRQRYRFRLQVGAVLLSTGPGKGAEHGFSVVSQSYEGFPHLSNLMVGEWCQTNREFEPITYLSTTVPRVDVKPRF